MAAGGRSPFLTAASPQRPGAFVSPSPPWLPHGHGQVEAREGAKEEAAGGQVTGGRRRAGRRQAPPALPSCSAPQPRGRWSCFIGSRSGNFPLSCRLRRGGDAEESEPPALAAQCCVPSVRPTYRPPSCPTTSMSRPAPRRCPSWTSLSASGRGPATARAPCSSCAACGPTGDPRR